MGIVSIKIFKSQGGRSVRGQWSNTYHINTENAMGSVALDNEAMWLVAMEKSFHLANTHFMRVVLSTYEKEGRVGHPEAVRTIELDGTGGREIPAGVDFMPIDIGLAVKTLGTVGRAGQMVYRGYLLETDVSGNSTGAFNYNPGDTKAQNAFTTYTVEGVGVPALVIPNGTSEDGTPGRQVSALKASGVIVKKHDIRRKAKQAVTEGNLLDNLDVALGILAAAGVLVMTKGKGMEPALKAAAAARAAGVGSIVGQIIESLTELVDGD